MSTALAIAAVTRALRNLLDSVATLDFSSLPTDSRPNTQIEVTTLPLDRARVTDAAHNRLNLFLYHMELNAAWRNQDLPRQARPGESSFPPLALNLHYLVTAYAEGDNELVGQVLLGHALSVLHDHPLLSRSELRASLADSGVDTQFERVRVTYQPISVDELSKIWGGAVADFRLSGSYQVALVLIDSTRAKRAALPVLRRGGDDRGPQVLAAPAPSLLEVSEFFNPSLATRPPHGKPAAELGDVLVLHGTNLGSDSVSARFRHDRLSVPTDLPILPERSDSEVQVALPAANQPGVPAAWPAGFYTVELVVDRPSAPSWTTNRLPFALAPQISSIAPANPAASSQPFDLTLTCVPQVLPEQHVVLLVGDREVQPSSVATPADPDVPTTCVFPINGLAPGSYVLRLRVDGADSIPIDFSSALPQFDLAQTLVLGP